MKLGKEMDMTPGCAAALVVVVTVGLFVLMKVIGRWLA